MPRKHYTPSSPETLLVDVIKGLEGGEDTGLEAVGDLIMSGPLIPFDAWGYGTDIAPVLLRFLRELVSSGDTKLTESLRTRQTVGFGATLHEGQVEVGIKSGDGRDLAVLQLIVLLHQVGLRNVRVCSALDCERIYVKVNRRLFCSPQCQKREYARAMRGRQRELRERRRRARQRRQRPG